MASSLEEDLKCSVCLGLFQDPHMLSCGHNFCLACLQGCLSPGAQGALCPECRLPFQLPNLVQNRALANMARKVRHLEVLPGKEDFCEKHNKPLKLFCLQDRLLICVICRDVARHQRHCLLPTKDAMQVAQETLKPYRKVLKKNLTSITRAESLQEKEITTLESVTAYNLKEISKAFDVLYKILHEKEQLNNKYVQEMKEENLKKMKATLTFLKENKDSQAETLANIQAALVTTDHIAFLKDFKTLLDKVHKYPLEEEDKGESTSDEEEASNKNREHSDQKEARKDEEEGGGDEGECEIKEFGGEKEEEEDEGNLVLVDPALEEFKDNLDAWKEIVMKNIIEEENEEETTDDDSDDESD